MSDLSKYLVLDEERNAMDYLIQSLIFLTQVEQNRFYLKWFVVAFHGALYSFMLLVLQKVKQEQIYKKLPSFYQHDKTKKKKEFDPFDGKLLDFLVAYKYLKNPENMAGQPFVPSSNQDRCMGELNSKLRNQFVHFRPMVSAYEPWYPAEVCLPLLEILKFCIQPERVRLSQPQKNTGLAYIDSIDRLLVKHAERVNQEE